MRETTSCYSDGANLMTGIYGMVKKKIFGKKDDSDGFNLNDFIKLFFMKCNYLDTVEGTFLSKMIINFIDAD